MWKCLEYYNFSLDVKISLLVVIKYIYWILQLLRLSLKPGKGGRFKFQAGENQDFVISIGTEVNQNNYSKITNKNKKSSHGSKASWTQMNMWSRKSNCHILLILCTHIWLLKQITLYRDSIDELYIFHKSCLKVVK